MAQISYKNGGIFGIEIAGLSSHDAGITNIDFSGFWTFTTIKYKHTVERIIRSGSKSWGSGRIRLYKCLPVALLPAEKKRH
jgi:hypothetical protein